MTNEIGGSNEPYNTSATLPGVTLVSYCDDRNYFTSAPRALKVRPLWMMRSWPLTMRLVVVLTDFVLLKSVDPPCAAHTRRTEEPNAQSELMADDAFSLKENCHA